MLSHIEIRKQLVVQAASWLQLTCSIGQHVRLSTSSTLGSNSIVQGLCSTCLLLASQSSKPFTCSQTSLSALAETRPMCRQKHMGLELEDGEMPPLPNEETLPSSTTSPLTDSAPQPTDSVSPIRESDPPVTTSELPSLPSDPPPLPPSEDSDPRDTQTAPPATSEAAGAMPSSATQPAQRPDAAVQAGTTAAEPSSEADMELDMEVDAEGTEEGISGRPVSAEPLPSTSGSQLPNWAGFYRAHNQAYPYYGEPVIFLSMYALTGWLLCELFALKPGKVTQDLHLSLLQPRSFRQGQLKKGHASGPCLPADSVVLCQTFVLQSMSHHSRAHCCLICHDQASHSLF